MTQSLSPAPKKDVSKQMTFPEAIGKIIEGAKIHRLEWQEQEYYGVLADGRLKLHKLDGKLHDWIITDGDLVGKDWIVL